MITLRSALNFEIGPIQSAFAYGAAWTIGLWWAGMPGELIAVVASFVTGLGAFWNVFFKELTKPVDIQNPRHRRREIRSTLEAVLVTALLVWFVDFVYLVIGMVLLMSLAGHCILVKEIARLVRRRYSLGGTPIALPDESAGAYIPYKSAGSHG
jgi:hypothetical protein